MEPARRVEAHLFIDIRAAAQVFGERNYANGGCDECVKTLKERGYARVEISLPALRFSQLFNCHFARGIDQYPEDGFNLVAVGVRRLSAHR